MKPRRPRLRASTLRLRARQVFALLLMLAGVLSGVADAAELTVRVIDRDGHPVANAPVAVATTPPRKADTDRNGQATLELDEGTWRVSVSMSGRTTDTTVDLRGRHADATLTLDLYRFQILLSASTGELLDGGQVDWRCGETAGQAEIVDGIAAGYAAPGTWQGALHWRGFTVPLPPFQIPDQRRVEADLAMLPVTVTVRHRDTGRGFGRVLISAASPGQSHGSPQWSDASGRLTIYAFPGPLDVQMRWFSYTANQRANVPGEATFDLSLPLRVVPWPDAALPGALQIQVRQPGFSAWLSGSPDRTLQLPLPEGRYDVVLYDPARKPVFRGVATVDANSPEARITWSEATGSDDDLRPRRLVWPRAVSPEPPAVAVADRPDEPLDVSKDGSLGLLPDGIELSVPPHRLGVRTTVSSDVVEVAPGAILIELAHPQPVRIADARAPERAIVQDCGQQCRILVAPGLYLVYAPDAELLLDPVEVRGGQVSRIRLGRR
ncbi:MAG: hypothetical protein D6761_00730 [Candidatus Dadabacteria bacterium]|nr:MAG: hypothetical protein D6761_00730 [Candidatus Dadabacteria bacterium]